MTRALDQAEDRDRWAAIVAAEARGEAVSSGDAEMRRRFEQESPDAAKEEAWLWSGLGGLGAAPGDTSELSDSALADRVLALAASRGGAEPRVIADAPPAKVIALGRPRMRRSIAGAFAAIALAAALAALASELLSSGSSSGPSGDAPTAPAPSVTAVSGGRPGAAGLLAPAASPEAPQSAAADSNGDMPETKGNAADLTPHPIHPDAPREAHEPPSSADALLKKAQTSLGEGRAQEAVASYKALLSSYPSSAEARAALVSLGRLSLGGGNAAEALGYFDRYLAGSGGPLGVEARYGRIQSLRRLGRVADELSAIQDFLARHGDSVYAPRLRERLESAASRPSETPDSPNQ